MSHTKKRSTNGINLTGISLRSMEGGIRSGTLNVPGIVGFGEACRLCADYMSDEARRIASLRDNFEGMLMRAVGEVHRNGCLEYRLPGNSSLTFPGLDAEAIIANTPNLAISTGSACNSGALEPSHVLRAIGLGREDAFSTIRIGLGRFTSADDIDIAVASIIKTVERLSAITHEVVSQ